MDDALAFFDWLHWDDGHHQGGIGLGSGGIYQVAKRFEPDDLHAYEGFRINKLRLFVNHLPTSAAIKLWKGESQDSLQEIVHQEFSPVAESWIEVMLDEPHVIDASEELWIGVEYDDPGEGVFPASRDISTNQDGKGNLIRMNVEDPDGWGACRTMKLPATGTCRRA